MQTEIHHREIPVERRLASRMAGFFAGAFLFVSVVIVFLILLFVDRPTAAFASRYEGVSARYVLILPAWVSFVLALLFIGAAIFLLSRVKKKQWEPSFGFAIAFGSVALAILQVFIVRSTYYEITWDPGMLLAYAKASVFGEDLSEFQWYFDLYPNNYFLAMIFKYIAGFSVFTGFDPSFVSAAIGALLVNIAGVLLAVAVRLLTQSRGSAYFAWIAFAVLACLSPWIAVPYSDTYLAPFVSGALLIPVIVYRRPPKRPFFVLLCFAWGLCVTIGSLIKPTILVLAIATALVLTLAGGLKAKRFADTIAGGIAACLAALLCFCVISPFAKGELGIQVDDEKAMSFTHYLMMGANSKSLGAWDSDDTAFSRGLATSAERSEENIRVYLDRLGEFGATGYVKFLAKKAIFTFYDGTFFTGGEGQSFDEDHIGDNPYGSASELVRALYYCPRGEFSFLKEAEQVLWFGMLVLLPFAYGFFRRIDRGGRLCVLVPMVSFIGVVVFLLLFETRSRYLYCFLPLIILLSSMGFSFLRDVHGRLAARRHAMEKLCAD